MEGDSAWSSPWPGLCQAMLLELEVGSYRGKWHENEREESSIFPNGAWLL